MSEKITVAEAAKFLSAHDHFLILTHVNPDGDTLGAGFGLCGALRALGKHANVINTAEIPLRYLFLFEQYRPQDFAVRTVVAVDIADTQLLGENLMRYAPDIDLCIDHHISNTLYARQTLLDVKAAATCEIIYELALELGAPLSNQLAKCLYTGIATDTGCFKYGNTTAKTHEIAAKLIGYDIEFALINHLMFDLKTKNRLLAEQRIIESMEFYYHDMCAMVTLTQSLMSEAQVSEEEFDGLSSIPRQIEGVHIGVTVKERGADTYKISMRSSELINVSELCQTLGGGGHARAAGCTIHADLEQTKQILLKAIGKALAPYLPDENGAPTQ